VPTVAGNKTTVGNKTILPKPMPKAREGEGGER